MKQSKADFNYVYSKDNYLNVLRYMSLYLQWLSTEILYAISISNLQIIYLNTSIASNISRIRIQYHGMLMNVQQHCIENTDIGREHITTLIFKQFNNFGLMRLQKQ